MEITINAAISVPTLFSQLAANLVAWALGGGRGRDARATIACRQSKQKRNEL